MHKPSEAECVTLISLIDQAIQFCIDRGLQEHAKRLFDADEMLTAFYDIPEHVIEEATGYTSHRREAYGEEATAHMLEDVTAHMRDFGTWAGQIEVLKPIFIGSTTKEKQND
tara:strand:- start:346 stop:681 length:336 start_codon:yes stop_codon:yes gene_type:complete